LYLIVLYKYISIAPFGGFKYLANNWS